MDKGQLLEKVIRPTLKAIPRGWSANAELAILMIIAHESNCGHYLAQLKDGPAKGVIQMEGWVHDDTWENSDSIKTNALTLGFISQGSERPHSDKLYSDLAYNVFMARQRLFMDTRPLPSIPLELSKYLKVFWNSAGGKAKDFDYLTAYNNWD